MIFLIIYLTTVLISYFIHRRNLKAFDWYIKTGGDVILLFITTFCPIINILVPLGIAISEMDSRSLINKIFFIKEKH